MLELKQYLLSLFSDPLVADLCMMLFIAICATVLFKLLAWPFFKD